MSEEEQAVAYMRSLLGGEEPPGAGTAGAGEGVVAAPSPDATMTDVSERRSTAALFARYGSQELQELYESDPDRFHNDTRPYVGLKKESPVHRLMIYMKACGASNKEIAEKLDLTPQTVANVLKQPWARLRLVEELRAQGHDALQGLLKGTAADSIFRLIEERDNANAKPSERIAAANSLLDRFLGKPIQKVEERVGALPDPADVEAIDRELQAVVAEEKRLAGTN